LEKADKRALYQLKIETGTDFN